ncbi:hypothetical protein D1AOALGA4SA_6321 [Olavius algarvensis Delta 1 endosymbiont]|nr:hypothetical protein D1AOALGA4SA_6321 [Olavius algarvensis Delta 1 endosymbiont]
MTIDELWYRFALSIILQSIIYLLAYLKIDAQIYLRKRLYTIGLKRN